MNDDELDKLLRRIETRRLFNAPLEAFPLAEIVGISHHFIQHSVQAKDWRFLNTALKLNDWLRSHEHITPELERMEEDAVIALRTDCGLNSPKM